MQLDPYDNPLVNPHLSKPSKQRRHFPILPVSYALTASILEPIQSHTAQGYVTIIQPLMVTILKTLAIA